MKVRHLILASVIAAISFLAFVFSTWMNPLSMQSTTQVSHSEQLFCSIPTSSSVHIAEVKPKLAGFGTNAVSVFATSLLLQTKSVGTFEHRTIAAGDFLRPLWLLHRSLLI